MAAIQSPDALILSGNWIEKLNGTYKKDARVENGRPTYRMQGKYNEDKKKVEVYFIWNWALKNKSLWMISREEHVGTQDAYCVVDDSAETPLDITSTWMCFKDGKYPRCETLTIAPVVIKEEEPDLLGLLSMQNDESEEELLEPFPEDEFTEKSKAVSNKKRGSFELDEAETSTIKKGFEETDELYKQMDELGLGDLGLSDDLFADIPTNLDAPQAPSNLDNDMDKINQFLEMYDIGDDQ